MQVELVESLEDIINNIKTIDYYLEKKVDPEYSYAINLIKRGTCFIKYNNNFYPSRFIGYKNNTMTKHESNEYKDGRVTNKQIGRILGESKPQINEALNREYQSYCETLGFEAREKGSYGVERKYWEV